MIKSVRVKNFKSFDDVTFELHKNNIIVGPNGVGKSNFIDIFLFLKTFIRPEAFPPYPFIHWGGYKNLVYMNDDNANIEIEVNADNYYYRLVVNGKEGLKVLEEDLKYHNIEIKRKYNEVKIGDQSSNIDISSSIFHIQRVGPIVLSPIIFPSSELINFMSIFGNDIVVLRFNPYIALSPVPYVFPSTLRVDGYGLPKVLFSQLPKPIQDFLSDLNMSLKIEISLEGNFIMYLLENVEGRAIQLHPSSIPSGIIKMLAILSGIFILKPSIILIDEIENSLHLNFLERLIDIFNYTDSQVVLTTHSPMVIDLVDNSDVIILDKDKGRTIVKRIENVNKLKEYLKEKGLLLSEYLYYS
jgi:AAA15 family ATPase/GTPase